MLPRSGTDVILGACAHAHTDQPPEKQNGRYAASTVAERSLDADIAGVSGWARRIRALAPERGSSDF